MRAAYYERTGRAAEVLTIGELPEPHAGAGEVRLRMQWSGINPSDVKSRSGVRSSHMPFARVVPHSDGMGVIDEVGEGVQPSRLGERAWVWNAAWGRPDGTAAQFVVLPAEQAVLLPDASSGEAGACLGIPAMTALHALLVDGGVAGRKVLVAGGAGAVGHYAIQFARLLGARQVIATVSDPRKAALAEEAGAHVVIDYRQQDVVQCVRAGTAGGGVDRIVEVNLSANALIDVEMLAPRGVLVGYGSADRDVKLSVSPLIAKGILARFFIVYALSNDERSRASDLLCRWLAEDKLEHNIAARLALKDIAIGHELVEQGQAVGNVVIAMD